MQTRRFVHGLWQGDVMDLEFSPEEIAFRQVVRDFLKEKLPRHLTEKDIQGRELTKAEM